MREKKLNQSSKMITITKNKRLTIITLTFKMINNNLRIKEIQNMKRFLKI